MPEHTVAEHFENRSPEVEATYRAILAAAKKLGPVREEAKKTSIHLARKTAFAGVATRRNALILTLKAAADIPSDRIAKRERVSANRWHHEVRLERPEEVDAEAAGVAAAGLRVGGVTHERRDMSQEIEDDDLLPEYDFSGAVRGKYYERYREGANLLLLDPDVAEAKYSESVNRALRLLLKIVRPR